MKKKRPNPAWWRNSFYWFAAMLLVVAIIGVIKGEGAIRDPGQVFENGLTIFYLLGAVLMFVNGWITQKQAIQAHEEEDEE